MVVKTTIGARLARSARRALNLVPPALLAAAAVSGGIPARGAAIAPGFALTAAEAGRPILLDADGRQIRSMHGLRGPSVVRPAGAQPAYVAYRLGSAGELPAGYPTIQVQGGRPAPGQPATGPLRLDAAGRSNLDAELARTGAVAVRLPRQTYLVESVSTALGASGGGGVWLAPTSPAASPAHGVANSGGASVGDTMKGWFDDGVNAIQNMNKSIGDSLKKQLNLGSPKPAAHPSAKGAKTAAEMLIPPTSADDASAAAVQPAPVPEPSTLVVFALAAAAGAFGARARRAR